MHFLHETIIAKILAFSHLVAHPVHTAFLLYMSFPCFCFYRHFACSFLYCALQLKQKQNNMTCMTWKVDVYLGVISVYISSLFFHFKH